VQRHPASALSGLPSGQRKCFTMCRLAASGKLQRSAWTSGKRQVWAVLYGHIGPWGNTETVPMATLNSKCANSAVVALLVHA
jgi:hypothetical protein